jgi:(p)ppGpp synthase/HD superfamily hydrolase
MKVPPVIPPLSEAELQTLVTRAHQVAKEAHRGQKRNDGKTAYITHPEAVAERLGHPQLRPLCLLHDVIEQTPFTEKQLREDFPAWIADRVMLLTRQPGVSYADYILQTGADWACRSVKRADLEHNMADLKAGSLLDKYAMALLVLSLFDTTETLSNILNQQKIKLHLAPL